LSHGIDLESVNMEKPAVLIVGAGALGITTGYHLALAGADVTFLVRSGRLEALSSTQVLYCYDDGELKQFDAYSAVATVEEAARKSYDFVLVTMDGATCRGEEATALLEALGRAIGPTSATVIVCGMGVREHCRQVMGLSGERVLEGTMRILSYQLDRVTLPLHPPTDPEQLAKASMAYRHVGGIDGFMVVDQPARPAGEFVELYTRCGISRCQTVKQQLYTMFTRTAFPTFAVFDLAGWPDAATMADNKALASLCCRAIKEIMRLPEHGWAGKLGALLMGRKMWAKMNVKTEHNALPVDYQGFNRFHHGGKVREQDIDMMRQSLESGHAQGKSMPALEELLQRYEAHCAAT
jgi:hypothetical protein